MQIWEIATAVLIKIGANLTVCSTGEVDHDISHILSSLPRISEELETLSHYVGGNFLDVDSIIFDLIEKNLKSIRDLVDKAISKKEELIRLFPDLGNDRVRRLKSLKYKLFGYSVQKLLFVKRLRKDIDQITLLLSVVTASVTASFRSRQSVESVIKARKPAQRVVRHRRPSRPFPRSSKGSDIQDLCKREVREAQFFVKTVSGAEKLLKVAVTRFFVNGKKLKGVLCTSRFEKDAYLYIVAENDVLVPAVLIMQKLAVLSEYSKILEALVEANVSEEEYAVHEILLILLNQKTSGSDCLAKSVQKVVSLEPAREQDTKYMWLKNRGVLEIDEPIRPLDLIKVLAKMSGFSEKELFSKMISEGLRIVGGQGPTRHIEVIRDKLSSKALKEQEELWFNECVVVGGVACFSNGYVSTSTNDWEKDIVKANIPGAQPKLVRAIVDWLGAGAEDWNSAEEELVRVSRLAFDVLGKNGTIISKLTDKRKILMRGEYLTFDGEAFKMITTENDVRAKGNFVANCFGIRPGGSLERGAKVPSSSRSIRKVSEICDYLADMSVGTLEYDEETKDYVRVLGDECNLFESAVVALSYYLVCPKVPLRGLFSCLGRQLFDLTGDCITADVTPPVNTAVGLRLGQKVGSVEAAFTGQRRYVNLIDCSYDLPHEPFVRCAPAGTNHLYVD